MANSSYLRAFPGSKAKQIDSARELNDALRGQSPATKAALVKMARRAGVTIRVEADLTSVTSTTLANSTEFGYFDVKAGIWYEYELWLQLTNGSAANGCKVDVTLSGTQTSLKGFGVSSVAVGTADPTDAATSSISTQILLTTSQDTTSPFFVAHKTTFKPVNDGKLLIQLAEKDTGGGTLVLKQGSYMRVRVLE